MMPGLSSIHFGRVIKVLIGHVVNRKAEVVQGNRVNEYVTNRQSAESMPILDSLEEERPWTARRRRVRHSTRRWCS